MKQIEKEVSFKILVFFILILIYIENENPFSH